jgi:oligopeptidase B
LLAPAAELRDRIYGEIRGRVQETDETAPVPDGPWEYFTRTIEGEQYVVHCRRPRSGGAEQVLLDENALARGHDYFSLGGFEVSPDHRLLAYSTDVNGGRYTLHFRDLERGEDLSDRVENVTYGLAWAGDFRTCFYVRPDVAMRPDEVWRHRLGTAADADVLVFREDDERFFIDIGRTRSGTFVLIDSSSKLTAETWFVPTDAPESAPRIVDPRLGRYPSNTSAMALGDASIVRNADGAQNFKLVAAPVDEPGRAHWTEVVPHRADVRLDAVNAFADHVVLSERADGLDRVRILGLHDDAATTLPAPDPVFSMWVGPNAEFDAKLLRYGYTSLVAPVTDLDYDPAADASTVLRVQPVLGGFDPGAYTARRHGRRWHACDLARPRRDVVPDGRAPLLLAGYGAYEHSSDPTFRASRLSLLDRGFVCAIAHVRGGGELGRAWYEDGKLAHKANTFTDFIACADALVANGYTSSGRIVARGGSAGGLLMGAIANLRPELFAAIVAEVPFVDIVTTMLDPDLPLTITEWEEWGDPREPDAYARMKAYSPYDNVDARAYPAMFVTTGLNDPRVQYWEPAKWVAKLREDTTSDRPILLRTEMGAGHSGPSGRYDAWRDEAAVLAFVCSAVGLDT